MVIGYLGKRGYIFDMNLYHSVDSIIKRVESDFPKVELDNLVIRDYTNLVEYWELLITEQNLQYKD